MDGLLDLGVLARPLHQASLSPSPPWHQHYSFMEALTPSCKLPRTSRASVKMLFFHASREPFGLCCLCICAWIWISGSFSSSLSTSLSRPEAPAFLNLNEPMRLQPPPKKTQNLRNGSPKPQKQKDPTQQQQGFQESLSHSTLWETPYAHASGFRVYVVSQVAQSNRPLHLKVAYN